MKNNLLTRAAVLGAIALVGLASAASAKDVYITTDTTLNSSNPVTGNAVVGRDSGDTIQVSPTVNLVTGGSVSARLIAYNSSIVNINGGVIKSAMFLNNASTANLYSGSIGGGVDIGKTSTFNFFGGSINENISTLDNSIANISGGSVTGFLISNNSSIINLSGGSIDSNGRLAVLEGSSRLNISGTGLSDTLTNPNDGGFSVYTLSGLLADGTDITGETLQIQNSGTANVNFVNAAAVPEPGSVALLVGMASVGAGVLRRRRK